MEEVMANEVDGDLSAGRSPPAPPAPGLQPAELEPNVFAFLERNDDYWAGSAHARVASATSRNRRRLASSSSAATSTSLHPLRRRFRRARGQSRRRDRARAGRRLLLSRDQHDRPGAGPGRGSRGAPLVHRLRGHQRGPDAQLRHRLEAADPARHPGRDRGGPGLRVRPSSAAARGWGGGGFRRLQDDCRPDPAANSPSSRRRSRAPWPRPGSIRDPAGDGGASMALR